MEKMYPMKSKSIFGGVVAIQIFILYGHKANVISPTVNASLLTKQHE